MNFFLVKSYREVGKLIKKILYSLFEKILIKMRLIHVLLKEVMQK